MMFQRTLPDEIKNNCPPFRRPLRRVRPNASNVEEYQDGIPKSKRPAGVDISGFGALKLAEETADEGQ